MLLSTKLHLGVKNILTAVSARGKGINRAAKTAEGEQTDESHKRTNGSLATTHLRLEAPWGDRSREAVANVSVRRDPRKSHQGWPFAHPVQVYGVWGCGESHADPVGVAWHSLRAKVKPFKTMSLVGMTQGARKRAWLRGALNDYLFPHQNSTGAEHDVRSDYSWSEIRVDAPFLGTKLGERLRPCPGCSTCARPCHYCEMQEPDDSRCPRCGQVMYSTPICDGSGVLPAKRSGVAG